jgi:hypothetical protein
VTPTHDAYLDNGTDIGLTVGVSILAYAEWLVKVAWKIKNSLLSFYSNFKNLWRSIDQNDKL